MAENNNVVVLDRLGDDEVSLLEILDHVVNAGVVIHGSLVISLAGVDLLYVGLNLILTSVETALQHMKESPTGAAKPRRALR
jgi:hypothetical protein